MSLSREAVLARAAGLLEAHGLTAADLAAHLADDGGPQAAPQPPPTVAGWIEVVREVLHGETARTYETYWRVLRDGLRLPVSWPTDRVDEYLADARAANTARQLRLPVPAGVAACVRDDAGRVVLADGYGERLLTAVKPSDLRVLVKWVRLHALAKAAADDRRRHAAGRPGSGSTGDGAVKSFLLATACLYRHAEADRLVPAGASPAAGIAKPGKSEPAEQTMTETQLADLWRSSAHSGSDPVLDGALARFHLLTASRPKGALELTLADLDVDRQAVWIAQKGRSDRLEVPVPRSLLDDLHALATARGSRAPADPVFRTRRACRSTGESHPPLTRRHYNTWAKRVRDENAWARQAEFEPYWLRHHAAATVEAIGGRAVKARLLGHKPQMMSDRYGIASSGHLAWAVAAMSGEPHPLSQRPPWL